VSSHQLHQVVMLPFKQRTAVPIPLSLKLEQALQKQKPGELLLEGCGLDDETLQNVSEQIVQRAPHITRLDVSHNTFTKIPENLLNKLTQLQDLYLYTNRLEAFPEEVLSLVNLKSLWLSDNKIPYLTHHITKLANLRQLYLRANKLTQVPSQLCRMTSLRELWLSANSLSNEQLQALSNIGGPPTNCLEEIRPILAERANQMEELLQFSYTGGMQTSYIGLLPKEVLLQVLQFCSYV